MHSVPEPLARLEAERSALDTLGAAWTEQDARRAAARGELLARYASAPAAPATIGGGDAAVAAARTIVDVDALYRSARDDLRTLREEARQALDAISAPTEVPQVTGGVPLSPGPGASPDQISKAQAQLIAEEQGLLVREQSRRWANTEAAMGALRELQADAVRLLSEASPELQAKVGSFSSDGIARIQGELHYLQLMSRWYALQWENEARSPPDLLHDAVHAGVDGLSAFGALLLLAGYLFVSLRHRHWLLALRERMLSAVEDDGVALRVDRAFQLVGAVSAELLLLAALYLLFEHVLWELHAVPEIALLRPLAYAYGIYALALALLHRVLLNAVTRYRVVDPALNRKMRNSLRLVARLILGIAMYLIVAQALLGRGALYGIAVDFAWLGVLVVAWKLLRDWHGDIVSAYLRLYPQGSLALQVRGTADQATGLPVALAAFVFVAARGLVRWLQDTALSFEQTRKGLAYLLRRRLEKQAETQTRLAPDPSKLPGELLAALTEEPAPDGLTVNVFPALWEVVAWCESLAAGGHGAVIALSGQRGAGKTTWLDVLHRRAATKLDCTLHEFSERRADAAAVLRKLCETCGMPASTSEEDLVAALSKGPPRAVLLDVCQNVMLRAVGGLNGYQLLIRVARATSARVLWVLSFSRWPFEFLSRTHPDQDVYDRVIQLDGWAERDIGRLIEVRMAAAGYTADYSQLLLRAAPLATRHGGGKNAAEAAAEPMLESERISDRYHRVIWDYADGNPRVALHFWRSSLVPADGRAVTVRLFAMPSMQALELLSANTRHLLAALVVHENITAGEAARSLRFSETECASALRTMAIQGLLESLDGRYRVSCHWNRAVLRFLQRKNLLIA